MSVADRLHAAVAHHRGGRLAEAEALYLRALRDDPEDPETLHLLGVLHHQRGDTAAAADLIRRAIHHDPDVATYHCNLAEVSRALGEHEQAVNSCRRALQLRPGYFEATLNLGAALYALGRFAEAAEQFRAARALRQDSTAACSNLGDALRELGLFRQAVEAYRDALQFDSTAAHAHCNLAPLLLAVGEPDEALRHAHRAVELQPDSTVVHNNLGRCLHLLGYFDEALRAYDRALGIDPDSPPLCCNIGLVWAEVGNDAEAAGWFERALRLAPGDLAARCHLADLQRRQGDPVVAAERLRDLLREQPRYGEAHAALNRALLDEGDVEGAAADCEVWAGLAPESPAPHVTLGQLCSLGGDLGRAVCCLREALRLNPAHIEARAELATVLRDDLPVDDRSATEALVEAPRVRPFARAALLFGLAQVYDGRAEYDRAAAALAEANAIQKAHWAEREQGFDPEAWARRIDRLIEVFDPAYFGRVRGFGIESERPVFVVGMPRSGTTLVEQILAAHPRVFGAGERRFAAAGLGLLPALLGRSADPLDCLGDLTSQAARHSAEWHLGRLAQLDGGRAERVVDKMPDNYALLGWIVTLFPRARLIHVRRDPRDVALSCWMTNFAEIRWANDLAHIAARIRQYQRLMAHWRAVLPAPVLELDYEKLVADPERLGRRLLEWVGLDWRPECLEFHRTRRLVRTASATQVRRPIHRRAVGRWVHYREALRPLLELLPDVEA
jgi:tetratricopeptide (TPR) repeat protein